MEAIEARKKGARVAGPKPARKARRKIGPYTLPEIEKPVTHEKLVQAVYNLALQRPGLGNQEKEQLRAIKLTYGAGPDGVRGITYFSRWARPCKCGKVHGKEDKKGPKCSPNSDLVPFVAVCATAQESLVQVVGTTLHELGHVLAGWQAAHGPDWHAACAKLGLVNVRAAGTAYTWDNFESGDWQKALQSLPQVTDDGRPADAQSMLQGLIKLFGPNVRLPKVAKLKPCTAGWGVKGGKSRTTPLNQSPGSRLLLWECGCTPKPVKVRHAGGDLKAKCLVCGQEFRLVERSLPATRQPNGGQPIEAA